MRTQIRLLVLGVIIGFSVALIRFLQLQVLKSDFFRAQSHRNIYKLTYSPGPRGVIFDSKDRIIAANRLTYCATIRVQYSKRRALVENRLVTARNYLSQYAGVDAEKIKVEPKKLSVSACDLSLDEVEKAYDLRVFGIDVEIERNFIREVKEPSLAHVVGYLGRGQRNALKESGGTEQSGVTGLERCLDDMLEGIEGITRSVVNVRAESVGFETIRTAKPGLNVKLTIDSEWQRIAFEEMRGQSGAAVVMNAKTGELKVLLSTPVFNPNVFNSNHRSEITSILNNPEKPLLNRAVNGVYPPGSVIKMFNILGLYEFGKSLDKAYCPGFDVVAGKRINCHQRSGHGLVDLVSAISKSCDVYFYRLSKIASYEEIYESYKRFGFGRKTGVDCYTENPGVLLPRQKIKHSIEFEKAVMSIGQGAIAVTPVQLAVALAAVVNGGKILQPKVVQSIFSSNWITEFKFTDPIVRNEVPLDEKILTLVKEGMFNTVNRPEGTAYGARIVSNDPKLIFAGKTGTAQVVELQRRKELKSRRFDHHAWFIGYWPTENPEYVIVVIVEHGGSGGKVAAPVAGRFIERIHGL